MFYVPWIVNILAGIRILQQNKIWFTLLHDLYVNYCQIQYSLKSYVRRVGRGIEMSRITKSMMPEIPALNTNQ